MALLLPFITGVGPTELETIVSMQGLSNSKNHSRTILCWQPTVAEKIITISEMEMKYAMTGELNMAVGEEITSVEFELLFSLLCICFGIYGQEGLQKTIGSTLGIPAGSACPLHIVCEY